MWKALVYKEWLKTRWFITGIFLFGMLFQIYEFLNLAQAYRMHGMVKIWYSVVNKNDFLFNRMIYFPLVAAICIGLAQYVPEMRNNRLKLTLHLPIPEKMSLLIMEGFGLAVLTLFFAIHGLTLFFYTQLHFASEITASVFATVLPWYPAGIVAYVFITLICLEPTWKHRALYLLLMGAMLQVFFLSGFPAAYTKVLWLIAIVPLYLVVFPWLSIERFKQGYQD